MPPDPMFLRPDRTVPMHWGEFSYSDAGAGPPMVMIHGHGCSRHDWQDVLPHLKGRRIVCVDLRGHGGSAVPRKVFSIKNLAKDVKSLTEKLWMGKCDVVGHSLGGMVALEFLRQAPERVDKVALVEGWTALRYVGAVQRDLFECVPPHLVPQIQYKHHASLVRWMPAVRDNLWASVEEFDASEFLRQTPRRILEIYGDRGRPPPGPEALGVPRRPNIETLFLKWRGHYPHLEDPKLTGQVLRDFLIGEDEGGDPGPPDLPPPTLRDLAFR